MFKTGPPIEQVKLREVLETISEYERIVHIQVKPPIMSMRE